MKKLLIIFVLVFISSCSCDFHYRRLSKRCDLKKDTLTIHDTLITREVQKDTVFNYNQKDTVIIREGKLTVKYFYNRDSTVYISGKCAPDTIIREIRAPYNFVKPNVEYWPGWLKWAVIVIGALALVFWIKSWFKKQ